ncbi:amidohydrolase 2 [Mytilinidion resinicola]|uniref:Amidohydrolase 2 n=1 Tax=Mytilinidion resinicola TaxID=574789 RepID=A0A6A6Z0Q8_9PEZI|nr:amidohydrolase 2 [Mytilinidion resinicola]KAF2814746.1 amidohydrolase 2 [Mytilinidion resinicola]
MKFSSPDVSKISQNAESDDIDLKSLHFLEEVLASIEELSDPAVRNQDFPDFSQCTRIDTHTHPVPDWYRKLSPLAAGRDTPSWSPSAHLKFMHENKITRSIVCISTPQANLFPDDKTRTVALARVLNEFCAEVVRCYPDRFSFMAVVPLPYTDWAVREAKYALEELGAIGVGVMTNHDGLYPGDERGPIDVRRKREIVFVHPTDPVIRIDRAQKLPISSSEGKLVSSNPAPFRSGLGEFYFETARAISSLTASTTIHDNPSLHFRISHGAGAFPCIADRFLLGFPELEKKSRKMYTERFWYDSAGPVYPRQIRGLLAYDIPVDQMVFGTDYPYGIGFWDVKANINGLANAHFLSNEEKEAVFHENAKALWKGKVEGF